MGTQAIFLVAALLATDAVAVPRSPASVAAFKRQQPCPATGQARGACPGWIVDHVEPLCAGGLDAPSNMQWQTVASAKVKDLEEQRQCRDLRRQRH